jgi:hypothetical protein
MRDHDYCSAIFTHLRNQFICTVGLKLGDLNFKVRNFYFKNKLKGNATVQERNCHVPVH